MSEEGSDERVPRAITGLGVLLGGLVVAEVLAVLSDGRPIETTFLVGAASSLPFIAGITYGGYWLARSALTSERYGRIAGWCFGGAGGFLLFNVLLMAGMGGNSPIVSGPLSVVAWLRWAASLGGGLGLVVGLFEARAIEREVAAELATVRAEEADARRELLDYLNSLLRHEVLNTATVIDGYARLLENTVDDPDVRERLRVIHRQSRDLTQVIQDVRVLLDASRDVQHLEPVDLSAVLSDELTDLRDREPRVEVDSSLPDGVYVAADSLFPRIFSNLLTNAVEHNDNDAPRVSVTVEAAGETVTIRIEDDGPGISDDERDSLFDHESGDSVDHGLGLSLVAALVDRYDGEIELTETCPDGSVFTVTLPRTRRVEGAGAETVPEPST